MTPLDYYHQQVEMGNITSDAMQLTVVEKLQTLQNNLVTELNKRNGFFRLLHTPQLVKGIYLWGGVGIGKTFIMDCFYHTLPFTQKMRMHFHQFMQLIHNKLTVHQGEADPLQAIAKELAAQTLVLCFDELFVSDITDAMLLGRLFKALFSRGVCLVATSNVAPDDLYKNGLQRLNFLPAIALLKQDTEVIHMASAIDYRLRHLQQAGVFYTPLGLDTQKKMDQNFETLSLGEKIDSTQVIINDRPIAVKKKTSDIVWFEFSDICAIPRSQKDYLVIAEKYKIVFISDIPVIEPNEKDKICLFISLVDVLYDARVKLVISAAEPVEQLYNRGYMVMEYTRTHSRLLEMQSTDYFTSELNRDNT
ncbi:MAG: cell division protein ZapE [Gammaproteobacteria bacterium]|nr:cell division protein ZapE [Gammaproteobacteria bacterium]